MAGEQAAVRHDVAPHRNEIVIVGRLAAAPEARVLPSGDEILSFRVVVDRPPRRRDPGSRREPTVDTIDCAAVARALRRRIAGWVPGDLLEVHGALHRRFWRAGPSVASRCEIQVGSARRLSRAS